VCYERGARLRHGFGGRSELPARVAQLVEQLICNQLVGGSSPFSGSVGVVVPGVNGQVAKWPTATDCKSVLLRVRWFESILAHESKVPHFRLAPKRGKVPHFRLVPKRGAGAKETAEIVCREAGLTSGSSSVGRATAFQAVGRGFEPRLPLREVSKSLDLTSRCSSGVEHFLGKEEVESSILFNGSVVNI
jgi:hypothetical protein